MLKTTLGGRYSIISRLGAGGFGETYLAEDVQLPDNHNCVVKHLKPQSAEPEVLDISRRLFDSEAKVLHLLGSHDQIPRLLANFEENQEFYLVQEFVEGTRLDRELPAGKKWKEGAVVGLLQDVLSILEFVHHQKVIHRDIKPENIIRRKHDEKLVLIDFGAVKQVCTQLVISSKRAKSTITIGTSGYMPSEQANGHPHINSDIYAVGIIGIQALTGLDPEFIPKNPTTLELEWSNLAEVSPDLARILDKMVRYDFRQRYPSATEVLKDLESLQISVIAIPSNVNQSTQIELTSLSNNSSNSRDLATDIDISSSSNQLTNQLTELPQITQLDIPIALNFQTDSQDNSTLQPTRLNPPESQKLPKSHEIKVIIGSAIALLILISVVASDKIFRINSNIAPPQVSNVPPSPQVLKPDTAEVLLRQVEVLEQVQAKIKTGDNLQDIENLATKIPTDSQLRAKVDTEIITFKKRWELDKLAFNELNNAYKTKKWKNALTAYRKISTSHWQKEAKWIVDKAKAEIAAAIPPRLPKRIIQREFSVAPPVENTYVAPSPVFNEPPPQPIIETPSPAPIPQEKFSIPEAQ
jgi:serine/threonine protein kinase